MRLMGLLPSISIVFPRHGHDASPAMAGHFPPGLPRGAPDRRIGRIHGAGKKQHNSGGAPRGPSLGRLGEKIT